MSFLKRGVPLGSVTLNGKEASLRSEWAGKPFSEQIAAFMREGKNQLDSLQDLSRAWEQEDLGHGIQGERGSSEELTPQPVTASTSPRGSATPPGVIDLGGLTQCARSMLPELKKFIRAERLSESI
ncbi:MAG: hypothetical protein ACO3A2_09630, partial [Bdellovibrionia bacterium]